MSDSTQPSSRRLASYHRFREAYPVEIGALLHDLCGIESGSPVADINAGPGIFTGQLVARGFEVYAIDPRPALRRASERWLGRAPNFTSLAAHASETELADHCVEAICVVHGLPWAELTAAREEFQRILKPGGWVLLAWNRREPSSIPFLRAYENLLLEFGEDYTAIEQDPIPPPGLNDFYGHRHVRQMSFMNPVTLTWEALKGRLLASGYVPGPGDPDCPPMLRRLRQIYERHQQLGEITFAYESHVFLGRLI